MSEPMLLFGLLTLCFRSAIGFLRQIHAVANYRRLVSDDPDYAEGLVEVIRSTTWFPPRRQQD